MTGVQTCALPILLFADGEGENDESEVEAAWQPYSTRAMGQAILNRLIPPEKADEPVAGTGELSVEGPAEEPSEGNEVRIGMDGRTPDGAMPYEILKDKLEWLQ